MSTLQPQFVEKDLITRSSHRKCSVEKGVLKNLGKFTGKHLCWSLFFNKGAGLQACNIIKKRLQHSCFPVKFPKFSRTLTLKNICESLLLTHSLKKQTFCFVCLINNLKRFLVCYSFFVSFGLIIS